jgi:hypothetical protein
VISAIPIVGNLAVGGILAHGAITGAERAADAFGQGRYATGIFELGNAYPGAKAAGKHLGQGVSDVQGSWQRGEIQSLARNATSVIAEIWNNTGSKLFDRGYAIGETMPNGLVAGMGPGGAFKGEFETNPLVPNSSQPFKFDAIKRYNFLLENGRNFSASLEVIDKSIGNRITESRPRHIDPGIIEIVSALEKYRPGIVQEIMVKIRGGKGNDNTDLDIITDRAIIQLTKGKGLGRSINNVLEAIPGTEQAGKPVIGFVADGVDSRLLLNNPRRSANEKRLAFNTIESLISYLDSL